MRFALMHVVIGLAGLLARGSNADVAAAPRAAEDPAPHAPRASAAAQTAGTTGPVIVPESKVAPVYPEAGRQAGVEGVVRLEATIRRDGSVGAIRVLESPGKRYGFDQAAIDAVRQWRYRPALKDGRPVKTSLAITLEFTLDPASAETIPADAECAAREAAGVFWAGLCGVTNPELIQESKVAPMYPEIARKAGVEGVVILQAVVRRDGSVGEIKVLKSPGSRFGLDEAAIDAVRQWKYRPGLWGGRPVDVYFTVTVEFVLDDRGLEPPPPPSAGVTLR